MAKWNFRLMRAVVACITIVVIASAANAQHVPGYDPSKVPGVGAEGHYAELARDPQQIVYNGEPAWEYVVTLWNTGAAATGSTYEMWGFENDLILNKSYPGESWHGGACDNVIMECWSGYGIWANDYDLISPTLAQDGSTWGAQPTTGWAMPYPTDDYGAPAHVPADYVHFDGGIYGIKFHTGYLLDEGTPWTEAGLGQGAFEAADPDGSTPKDCIPIGNYWNMSTGGKGVMAAFRVVTTETFGADPGDSPIPQFSYARPSYFDILGNWEVATLDPGDFDGNRDIDADDIDILCANMGGDPATYDMDEDGDVDEDDLTYLIENLVEWDNGVDNDVGTYRGDFNLDGIVNATDLAIMKATFGSSGVGYADGNANCDTVVNATDLAILKGTFGFTASTGGGVPEPLTLGLLALGGLGLLRRKSQIRLGGTS